MRRLKTTKDVTEKLQRIFKVHEPKHWVCIHHCSISSSKMRW